MEQNNSRIGIRKFATAIGVSFVLGALVGGGVMYYLSKKVDAYGADASMLLASDAFGRDDMNTATAYAYEAMFKSPDSYSPYMLLGQISEHGGDSAYAIKMLQAALEKIEKTKGISGGIFNSDQQVKSAQIDKAIIEDKLKALREGAHK